MKPQYNENVNIKLNRAMGKEFDKYQKKKVKLFTNDVKVALISAPLITAIGLSIPQNTIIPAYLYITSACALTYAGITVYSNSKTKQKKFTLK